MSTDKKPHSWIPEPAICTCCWTGKGLIDEDGTCPVHGQ